MPRLRIVCTDGTAFGTTVQDADTGEYVEGVVAVSWSVVAGGASRAVIELDMVDVDALGTTSDVPAS